MVSKVANGKKTKSKSKKANNQPKKSANKVDNASSNEVEKLGKIAWLLMSSPQHKYLFLADLEWILRPALFHRQYRLYEKDGNPIGLATWAYLSNETEDRFIKETQKLQPQDWRSGENIWLVDLISPYGGSETMVKDLVENLFKDRPVKTFHTLNGKREITTLQEIVKAANQ